MWVAMVISLLGIGLSSLIGIKLPGLEYNNQRVEARFRKRLVYAEDDKNYADIPSLVELFSGLRFNYFRLYMHYSYFSLWQNFFFQFLIIVDFILIGPGILVGLVTLGVLNQVSHAFGKVSDSMAYLVGHWTEITELLSIIKRLREFEGNIGYSGKVSKQRRPCNGYDRRAGTARSAGCRQRRQYLANCFSLSPFGVASRPQPRKPASQSILSRNPSCLYRVDEGKIAQTLAATVERRHSCRKIYPKTAQRRFCGSPASFSRVFFDWRYFGFLLPPPLNWIAFSAVLLLAYGNYRSGQTAIAAKIEGYFKLLVRLYFVAWLGFAVWRTALRLWY